MQIAQKEQGRIVRIDHIGSAHSKEDLETLITLGRKRLLSDQQPLFKRVSTLESMSSTVGIASTTGSIDGTIQLSWL